MLLAEMARQTGLPQRALADAARAGSLRTYKAFGRRYVTAAQIDEYMKQFLVGEPEAPVAPKDATERFLQRVGRKRLRRANHSKE